MTRVLIVDDSPVDRMLVRQQLESARVSVEAAENGAIAKRMITVNPPDVIVTDMIMPEMDGLQLVEAVRSDHPNIPVILMTSRSTEEIATEALKLGAASFVPKSRLNDRLLDTLQQVLGLIRIDHPYREVLGCMEESTNQFKLASQLSLIPQIVDLVQRTLASMQVCDVTESIRVSLALEEGLLNALVHGSYQMTKEFKETGFQSDSKRFLTRGREEPYRDRSIYLTSTLSTECVKFVIRDEGPGFDTSSIRSEGSMSAFEDGAGRGMALMQSFMQKVSYNDIGNELTMVKPF